MVSSSYVAPLLPRDGASRHWCDQVTVLPGLTVSTALEETEDLTWTRPSAMNNTTKKKF